MKRLSLGFALALVALIVTTAGVAMFWTPYDPAAVSLNRLAPPSWEHPFGTDGFGFDVLSRIMAGSKTVFVVGIVSVAVAALIGIPVGIFAGMASHWWREMILRINDVLYAFPALLLAILLAAALSGSTWTAVSAIGLATIPTFVRVAMAGTLQIVTLDYVFAARVCGTSRLSIAWRHVFPNIAPLLGVQASVSFGIAILAEAGLSYLGLGSSGASPTWGRMLKDAQSLIFKDPLQALWPGLAISLAVFAFNLLGDSLRDYLDPRLKEVN